MEQVDLTRALLGLKEMCFWSCLAARKVLLQEQRLRQEGTAAPNRGAQNLSLCSPAPVSLFIAPCMAFLQPQAWAEL